MDLNNRSESLTGSVLKKWQTGRVSGLDCSCRSGGLDGCQSWINAAEVADQTGVLTGPVWQKCRNGWVSLLDWCCRSSRLDRCLGWTSAAEVADLTGVSAGLNGLVQQKWLTKQVSGLDRRYRSGKPDGCQ